MPVKSYLVIPKSGQKQQLLVELEDNSSCSVLPAENEELIVLVTDTSSKQKEKELLGQFENNNLIESLSLVSGFEQ
jgi:hypothetical protein